MIAAATTGGVKVWTLGPTAGMRTFRVEGSGATLSAFSGDGRLLASASAEGRLAVWNSPPVDVSGRSPRMRTASPVSSLILRATPSFLSGSMAL